MRRRACDGQILSWDRAVSTSIRSQPWQPDDQKQHLKQTFRWNNRESCALILRRRIDDR